MKRLALLFIAVASFQFAMAQTPAKSPASTIKQTVGLTDFTVEYSRPDADGRTIFGDLVPYDKVWRTGANKATKVSFSEEVTINNTAVPAGDYSLFTIPGKTEWTIILNTETELWGEGNYDKEKDQIRFTAKPAKTGDKYETFTIDFQNLETESANMTITWENTRVAFTINVKTDAQAWANIEKSISEQESGWRVYVRGAQYAVETGKNLDKAVEWTNKALAMEEYWWTYTVQGQVYAAKGDYKNAIKSTKKALELGKKIDKWNYADMVEGQLKEYEAKK